MPKPNKMKNNTHLVVVGISFLALGLVAGLLITNPDSLGSANLVQGSSQNQQVAQQDILDKKVEQHSVSIDDDAILGDPDAPVTIVEFSDYQCPYCAQFWAYTMEGLKEEYIDTGIVNFVYRDYPIDSHQNAQIAAEAAECAGEYSDEAYYEMHDALFATVGQWSAIPDATEAFVGLASEIGYDIATCMENGEQTEEVQNDKIAGRSYSVGGTPTLYINGWKFSGALSLEDIAKVIESEL
jgi:protein-disulfide isomerase